MIIRIIMILIITLIIIFITLILIMIIPSGIESMSGRCVEKELTMKQNMESLEFVVVIATHPK